MKNILLLLLLFISCAITSAQEIFKNDKLSISKIEKGAWIVEATDGTTMYIVEGTKRALLIDTGSNCEALDEIVRKITAKPLSVVITHNHADHSGNIRYFKEVYMHPLDSVIRMGVEFHGKYRWLKDGHVFDLGGRKIKVVLMQGHTPGSLVLLDPAINVCYSGDAFGSGKVWLALRPHLPMKTYYESCVRMEKIMKKQNITKIYCGHYQDLNNTLPLSYIIDMKDLAKRLSEGDTTGSSPYQMPFKLDIACDKPAIVTNGSATILYDSEKIN